MSSEFVGRPGHSQEVIDSGLLDLFSLSQTSGLFEIGSDFVLPAATCSYGAPMFAYPKDEKRRIWGISQGNCNHWDCPRCGVLLAKKHYGNIVHGAVELAKKTPLYFITLTCRGREMSREAAEAGYLKWTNRVLTAARTRAKREGQTWAYVQVTERQRRGHPHSHILTTWQPHDLRTGTARKWKTDNAGHRTPQDVECLRSDWLHDRCVSAGLGPQYDISEVQTTEAASRYVAKYLFKTSMRTRWPKRWKRIRYSHSWPRVDRDETDARVLLTAEDWYYLSEDAFAVHLPAKDWQCVDRALDGLYGHDVMVRWNERVIQFGSHRPAGFARWRSEARKIASEAWLPQSPG